MISADQTSLVARLSYLIGDRSDGVVSAPEPNITEDGDRPLSTDSDQSGHTKSHRTDFGAGFGDPFTHVMYVPASAHTEDGDRLLLTDSDHLGDTESHGADFSASCGDPFTYVAYAPVPTDTEVRNRISYVIPVGRPTSTKMHGLPPKCTGPSSVLNLLTSPPTISTYWYPFLPGMEIDRCRLILTDWEIPNHTGADFGLDSVTRSPMLRMHRHRLIPMMETNRY